MNTPKPEEQVEVKSLNSTSAPVTVPAEQKPSVPASLGQAVGDSVQSVLQEDPRIAEEWRKRHFLIVDDDPQVCADLSNGLRQKGVEDSRIVAVSDLKSAEQAIDQFLSQAQGGECLTLFCDGHFQSEKDERNFIAQTRVVHYASYVFTQWRVSHPDETNPPRLEIILTERYSIKFEDKDEKKPSEIKAPLVIGVCFKKDDCLDVFQEYLKGKEQNFTYLNMSPILV